MTGDFQSSESMCELINNLLDSPALFVSYNHSLLQDDDINKYYKANVYEYDNLDGFAWPLNIVNVYHNNSEINNESNKNYGKSIQHVYIGAKSIRDSYPTAIFSHKDITPLMTDKSGGKVENVQRNKYGTKYIANVICDYILCTAAIRYCKDTVFKRYYKLGYNMETNHVKSVNLRSLSCDAIADYEYTTSVTNNQSGLEGQINNLNEAMKTVIEVDQNITLTLDNNNINTGFSVDYNAAIDDEFNKYTTMTSVVQNKMYIIPELKGAENILKNALKVFGHSNDNITGADGTIADFQFRNRDYYNVFRLNKYTIH